MGKLGRGCSYGIARPVTGDEVNVEMQDIPGIDCEDAVGVVFVLVASTQVWVAGKWVYSILYRLFDWAGNVWMRSAVRHRQIGLCIVSCTSL